MISGRDIYAVLTALVPLNAAMLLAYGSVRWWKIFTPEQCSGINKFVAVFAFPFLSFNFIYSTNPYNMNLRFIAADTFQKVAILIALFFFQTIFAKKKYGSTAGLGWMITIFSLSTVPNTLVVGVPILKAMYGDVSGDLMVQIVLLQSIVWKTVMLIMFEYRAAKIFISEQFPHNAGSIKSVQVDSDVASIGGGDHGGEPLEAEAEIGDDEKLHVVVRRQSSSREASSCARIMQRTMSSEMVVQSMSRSNSLRDHERDLVHIFARNNSVDSRVSISKDFVIGSKRSSLHDQSVTVDAAVPRVEPALDKAIDGESIVAGSRDQQQMPPASVVIRLIFVIVCRKIIANPNSYTSVFGLIWSLIAFRWNIKLPKMVTNSIKILANCGLGMSMFSLGLFMALQPKLIPCGKKVATLAMCIRFLVGPAVMAAVSAAIGIRGVLFQIAVVQAALPQGIIPFVFAREYNVHPDIISTSVIFGSVLALPITIMYYVFLGL